MRFQLPPQIFQQSQMAPPAPVEPPMPQYPSNNPAIFQALQEKHAKLTSAAQKAQEKAQKLLEEAGQLKAPEQAQPMGYRDILPVGGLVLLAKLLGAKDRDLGEGLAGFAQGRQGWAQGENQTRIRNFEQQREALLNQGNMAQGQYSDLLKQALGAESQMFDVQKDERNFEQQKELKDIEIKAAKENAAEITKRTEMGIAGRKDVATIQRDKAFVLKLVELAGDLNDPINREKLNAAVMNAMVSGRLDAETMQDPDVIKAMSSETYKGAQMQAKTNLYTQEWQYLQKANPKKLSKLDADIKAAISRANLNDVVGKKIAEETRFIAPQYALRWAEARSKIEGRLANGEQPSPTEIKRLWDLKKAQLEEIIPPDSNVFDMMDIVNRLTPEEKEDLKKLREEVDQYGAAYEAALKGTGGGGGLGGQLPVDAKGGFVPFGNNPATGKPWTEGDEPPPLQGDLRVKPNTTRAGQGTTKPNTTTTKKTTAKVGDKLKGSGKFTFGGKK